MNSDSKDGLGIILGRIVASYRFIFELSITLFSNRSKISVDTISRLECGNLDLVPLQLFDKLATSMDMPLEYLITLCKEIKVSANNSNMINLLACNRLTSYYLKKSKKND